MSFFTLKEARQSAIANIAGLDAGTDTRPASDKFIQRLNEAVGRLLNRGDWKGTTVPMKLVAYNGLVVWPRNVEYVRALKIDSEHNSKRIDPTRVENTWYDFPEQRNPIDWKREHSPKLVSQAPRATYNDIFDGGGIVYAICQYAADNGKKLTIFGFTPEGLPIQTNNQDGTFTDGFTLTMRNDQGIGSYTQFKVGQITRVLKDVTQGIVQLFAFDSTQNFYLDLACYQGGETNPQYAADRLEVPRISCDYVIPITALVKLRHIKVVSDSDLVIIQNEYALKDMIQSLQYRESGDVSQSVSFEGSAFRELNFELRNSVPKDSINVTINTGIHVRSII